MRSRSEGLIAKASLPTLQRYKTTTEFLHKKEEHMPKKLGELLLEQRQLKGLNLRRVEEETGVSNGYLNLLENGKVGEPSPNILYKLAEFYGIEYADLLEAAGYASKGVSRSHKQGIAFSLREGEITDGELEELKRFIQFLKSKNGKKRK